MKYVLIRPNKEADVLFFKDITSDQMPISTPYLAKAHVFEYNEQTMQYVLDKIWGLQQYSAVPIDDVDIFKAKLAGK